MGIILILISSFLLPQCAEKDEDINSFVPLEKKKEKELLEILGEKLFFDTRLSIDNSISCASCHIPALAFTDGKRVSSGVHGRKGKRNSPSLFNVVHQDKFMWDGGVKTLELQALVPLQDTNEMSSMISDLIPELAAIPYYDSIALLISGEHFGPSVLTRALGAFQRSLYREESKFDKWRRGEEEVNEDMEAGYTLFTSELNCAKCHTPPTFTNNALENNGLYSDFEDPGRYRITGDSADIGKFKVPSLRNVELTSPYMHDGSVETLEEVVEHYLSGGSSHMNKSQLIEPFTLNDEEKKQLILFLRSLSDTAMKNHWQKVFNTSY